MQMQQIHEDKNKPTGKEIQVILTKVTWPYCSEENGQKKKKIIKTKMFIWLPASAADDWTEHESTQTNQM